MAKLHLYADFDRWFDVVADIDPLALDAPYRFTLGADRLALRNRSIEDVFKWISAHSKGDAHCLEPCSSPEEDEYPLVFEDVLDAASFRSEWGNCDVDMPTTEDRAKVAHGAAMMRKFRRDW